MNRSLKSFLFLSLGVSGVIAAFGLTTLMNAKPELSISQSVQIAGAMAKPLAQQLQGKPVVVDIYAKQSRVLLQHSDWVMRIGSVVLILAGAYYVVSGIRWFF